MVWGVAALSSSSVLGRGYRGGDLPGWGCCWQV